MILIISEYLRSQRLRKEQTQVGMVARCLSDMSSSTETLKAAF